MAETFVDGAIHCRSSGERPSRPKGNQAPPPLVPRDLISDLPDAVIHHIFSCLPIQDVVKTSHLSKRWRSTWTTATDLVFHDFRGGRPRNPDTYTCDFPSFVDSVLMRCTSPTVKRFHIINFTCEFDRSKLDHWLSFAEGRRVEDLLLWVIRKPGFLYILPPFLYCLSWLVRLEVTNCCFSLATTVRWPCLKVLLIRCAELSVDILEGIFRGSPVLESLELQNCGGVKEIVIGSTTVKELIFFQYLTSATEKLRAPHLLSLRISGYLLSSFRIDGMLSLVEAELDFCLFGNERMSCDFFKELFHKLREVATITIGNKSIWCLQILSLWEMEGVPSPSSKCRNLILHGPVSQWTLPGIAYMLRSARCLEKLVIHLTCCPPWKIELNEESKESFNFDEEDFLCSRKGNFECLAKHLKRVEITGIDADSFQSKHLLALIMFLLEEALVLEKLIIKTKFRTRHREKHLEAAFLSKLFDVGKNDKVVFDYPFEWCPHQSI